MHIYSNMSHCRLCKKYNYLPMDAIFVLKSVKLNIIEYEKIIFMLIIC